MKHYKNVLLDVIKIFDVHKLGRKNKYTTDFYIDNIFRILFYGECWNTFKCNKCDRSTIRKNSINGKTWIYLLLLIIYFSINTPNTEHLENYLLIRQLLKI